MVHEFKPNFDIEIRVFEFLYDDSLNGSGWNIKG